MTDADWCPGILHNPGANAGYNGGRSRMESIVCHYTAGAYGGDYAVGLDGYFNFYCPREEAAVQFAEADALCWHAGEWNDQGPGIELERRDDSYAYTDHQLDDLGRICHWLHDRYGIPLDRFYDTGGDNGARLSESQTAGMAITHRSLAQSGGWHSDYLTRDEWERALGGGFLMALSDDEQRRLLSHVDAMASTGIPALGLENLFDYASRMAERGVPALDLPNLFDGQKRILDRLANIERRLDLLDDGTLG